MACSSSFFVGRFRLLVDEGMTSVVISFEVGRGGFAAKIAVNALVIDVELPVDVLRIFVRYVGHVSLLKLEWKVKSNRSWRNRIFTRAVSLWRNRNTQERR